MSPEEGFQPNVSAIVNRPLKKKKPCRKDSWCDHYRNCGHKSQQCRVLNKHRSHYSFVSVCAKSSFSPSRFTVPVSFADGTQIVALVGTGADVSCIRKKLAASSL